MKAAARANIIHLILALSASALVIQTAAQTDSSVKLTYVFAVFFGVLLIYRSAYYGIKHVAEKKNDAWLFILAGCGALLSSIYLSFGEIVQLVIMSGCCMLYFFEYRSWKGLRGITFLKSAWVAFVWTVVTAWIPLGFSSGREELMIVVERFLYMDAICLIYNLRDVHADFTSGITTVPHRLGTAKTKFIAAVLLLIYIVAVYFHIYPVYILIAFSISTAVALAVTAFAKPNGNWLYYTLAVDGHMLFQALIVILFYVHNK